MTAQFQFFQSLPHKKADFVKKKADRTWGTEHIRTRNFALGVAAEG